MRIAALAVALFIIVETTLAQGSPPSTAPPPPPARKQLVVIQEAKQYGISYQLAFKIGKYADRYKIPHQIAFRVVQKESKFDSLADNKLSTATGLTQILLPTARKLRPGTTIRDLHRPDINLDLGFRFLHNMNKRYKGDWWRTLVGYTDGPAVADTLLPGWHPYADKILRSTQ